MMPRNFESMLHQRGFVLMPELLNIHNQYI